MIQDEKPFLPKNWEKMLEQMMLKKPVGIQRERMYICSPCRSVAPDGVLRNMIAARVYMLYAFTNFSCTPVAPHAYLPVFLDDERGDDRALALLLGKRILKDCGKLLVCGDRLSKGMYSEIRMAAKRGIPIQVFNEDVHTELCVRFICDGIDEEYAQYDACNLHYALSWGADRLAPYWEEVCR